MARLSKLTTSLRHQFLVITITLAIALQVEAQSTKSTIAAFTLEHCYKLALERAESLQINQTSIQAAQARYDELVASLYPLISANASHELSDTDRASNNSSNNSSANRSRNRSRFLAGVSVEQPVFSGFRDFLLAASADQDIAALRLDDIRTRQLLYSDVAQAFYQIEYYEEDLKELSQTEKVLIERIKELEQFVTLGKSKQSEMLTAQSDISDIQVQSSQSRGLLRAAREMLGYLIGQDATQLRIDPQIKPFLKEALDVYIARAIDRADINASKSREISKSKQKIASERETWGSVALQGNYDPIDAPSGDSSSSVRLNFDLPIFDFGRIDARTRQRQAELDATKLKTQQLKRQAERDVRIAWANLTSSEAEITQLKNLVAAASKAYDAQKHDYSLGIVNNLDVLQSIRNLQQARRRLIKAKYDIKTLQSDLLVATGEM